MVFSSVGLLFEIYGNTIYYCDPLQGGRCVIKVKNFSNYAAILFAAIDTIIQMAEDYKFQDERKKKIISDYLSKSWFALLDVVANHMFLLKAILFFYSEARVKQDCHDAQEVEMSTDVFVLISIGMVIAATLVNHDIRNGFMSKFFFNKAEMEGENKKILFDYLMLYLILLFLLEVLEDLLRGCRQLKILQRARMIFIVVRVLGCGM